MRARGVGRKCGVAIGLATVALAVVLVVVVTARPVSFLHLCRNLSSTAALVSAYPDMAMSPDGNWVVVVWTEEYTSDKGSMGHVYLRSASEVGGGWGNRIEVFHGSSDACAEHAAVVVSGTTAHVAYIVRKGEAETGCANPSQTEVRYRTCSLTSGQCSSEEEVDSVNMSEFRDALVDLALDVEGNPHVVWVRYKVVAGKLRDGDILYNTPTAGGWGGGEGVTTSGDNRKPAIAWADDHVHVVWEEENGNQILYRRRAGSGWSLL